MNDELVKTKIVKKEVVFHLVTKDDLATLSTRSWIADLVFALMSIAAGGWISSALSDIESKYVYIFATITIIAFIISLILFVSCKWTASKILNTSATASEPLDETTDEHEQSFSEKNILSALYFTPRKKVDVTAKIRSLYKENSSFKIDNESMGLDPEYGVVKQLKVKYSLNGKTLEKKFQEGQNICLP